MAEQKLQRSDRDVRPSSGALGTPAAGFDLTALLPSFERSLRAKRRAERTIEDYLKDARRLAAWLAEQGMPVDPLKITREHIEAFIVHELSRDRARGRAGKMSAGTVASNYRRIQQLFRWLEDEGEIPSNPMAKMSPPTVDQVPIPVIKPDHLRALLADCTGTTFIDRRDNAIVRLFLDTGMRTEEWEPIQLDDLDWSAQSTRVRGKGGKYRDCHFGAKTAEALDRYVRARARVRFAGLPWLWLGQKGRLTASGMAQMLARRCTDLGIPHIHPHMFRHTNAHSWLANGGSEGDLMELMGWSSRDMLGRYGKSAAAERARNAHRRMALGDQY